MTTKHIQALVGFHGVADGDVLKRGLNVVTNLTGNSKFPSLPSPEKEIVQNFTGIAPRQHNASL